MKKTIATRIRELTDEATKRFTSPVTYLFGSNKHYHIDMDDMHEFMGDLQNQAHESGRRFAYFIVTDETLVGYHYHMIVFTSDRDFGNSFRLAAFVDRVWRDHFPDAPNLFYPENNMHRLHSQREEFLKRAEYYSRTDKGQVPHSLGKHSKRYWSSHIRAFLKNSMDRAA